MEVTSSKGQGINVRGERKSICPDIGGNANNGSNRGSPLLIAHCDPDIILSFLPVLAYLIFIVILTV